MQLFNKVGDLYLKIGKTVAAVETYERAVGLYEEGGFPNNAIALCNKILRQAPARTPVYLRLAKLMLERGFVAEAKQNLLEYADRMQNAGQVEEAFRALKEFADLSPDNEEIRLLLAEQLKLAARTDEAREQLAKLYHEVESHGDARRSRATLSNIQAIDPDFDAESTPKPKVKGRKQKSSDLVFLNLDDEPASDEAVAVEEEEEAPAPLAEEALEIETTSVVEEEELIQAAPEDLEVETAAFAGGDELMAEPEELEIEPTSLVEEEILEAAEGLDLEPTSLVEEAPAEEGPPAEEEEEERAAAAEIDFGDVEPEGAEEAPAAAASGELDVPDLDLGGFEAEEGDAEQPAAATATADEDAALEDLELIAAGEGEAEEEQAAAPPMASAVAAPPADLEALAAEVADDPDNPSLHRKLGEALIEGGDRDGGLEELGHALRLYEEREEWSRAEGMADEILRLDPNSIQHHQKRVEFAFRRGNKSDLARAYLGLADALFRSGASDRARAVYQRVLEHDPDNENAKLALETLEPSVEEAAAEPVAAAPVGGGGGGGGDFVDLGALILGEEPRPKDTRMRIEEEEPTGDEQRDFEEMLSAFKKGIEANVAEEDWQAHYDLGVAFKEMGLLDEAIAEFQKALRAPEGRLKTAEALGLCFFEKEQYSVAATVLRRAVDADTHADDGKISLLYWIGRCDEEQGKTQEALTAYQRVFAVDINFQDVRNRVRTLAGAGS